MFVGCRRTCIARVAYNAHGGGDRITRLSNVCELPRHKIRPSVSKLVLKCSDPLYYHTDPCMILWESIESFNERVNDAEYSIEHMGSTPYVSADEAMCDDPDYAHTEPCRVYDL